jgi:tRNA1Val (adenine37-N6)-methyltransferase
VATANEGKVTKDALFGGRVTLIQPAKGAGYRTNVDAILLAAFAAEKRRKVRFAIDLGAGVGAVGLTLFFLGAAERIAFVDKDPAVADLCRRNLKANGWTARGAVHVVDLEAPIDVAAPELARSAMLVVANPPYVAPARDGRAWDAGPSHGVRGSKSNPSAGGEPDRPLTRPSAGRAAGRRGPLAPFVRAAAAVLGQRGRACFVYPAHALLELTTLARQVGFEPKRVRFVHGRSDRPARVALVEFARAKPGGLAVMPPLVEVGENGKPTAELTALLRLL